MPYEAKTNWKYDDTVTEKDLNRIEQGLKDAHVAEYKDITLKPGVQIVDVPEDTPFRMGEIRGRTLINLLGYSGKGDSDIGWRTNGELIVEKNELKTIVTNSNYCDIWYQLNLNKDSYYFIAAEIKTTGKARIRVVEENGIEYAGETTSPRYTTVYTRIPKNAFTKYPVYIGVVNIGEIGAEARVKNIRAYEISESEYNSIGSLPTNQVTALYPYIDAMTNVTNPYATITAGNLCPPFYKWKTSGWAAGELIAPYIQKISNPKGKRINSNVIIPTIPEATYTYSIEREAEGEIGIDFLNSSGEVIKTSDFVNGDVITSKAPPNAVVTRVWTSAPEKIGTYSFKNPMVVIGDNPGSFLHHKRSMWAAECVLAANPVDGSFPDSIFLGEDGLPYVLERWGKIVLDESLKWEIHATSEEYKQIRIEGLFNNNAIPESIVVMKYNGNLLAKYNAVLDREDQVYIGNEAENSLYLSISNLDSGWGKEYVPDENEIKAYFMGWRMTTQESWNSTLEPYSGIGTKGWSAFYAGEGPLFRFENGIAIVKGSGIGTTPTSINPHGYKGYKLQYLKVAPSIKAIKKYETGAVLHSKSNIVEVGSGIVLREKAKPVQSTYMWINALSLPDSWFKHKASEIVQIFCNNQKDDNWVFYRKSPTGYGSVEASIGMSEYDPRSIYHATYKLFDPVIPVPIKGEISLNLRSTVSELVNCAGNIERRLSLVESQKADKDVNSLIQLSTLNGYKGTTKYSDYLQGLFIRKDSSGYVWIHGLLCNGIPREIITKLPKEFRPKHSITFSVPMYSTSIAPGPDGEATTRIKISKDGSIISHTTMRLIEENGDWLSLHLPPFLAKE